MVYLLPAALNSGGAPAFTPLPIQECHSTKRFVQRPKRGVLSLRMSLLKAAVRSDPARRSLLVIAPDQRSSDLVWMSSARLVQQLW